MPVLPIAHIGAPVLRSPTQTLSSQQLASTDIQSFIDDLIETMRAANGAGLAANQVHKSLRICVIEVSKNPRYPHAPAIPLIVLVNPKLSANHDEFAGETFANYEGCLSVPNLRGVVHRIASIRVQALDRHGNKIDQIVRGFTAGVFQHECDHLDGKLFVDRVEDLETLTTLENYIEHRQAQVGQTLAEVVSHYGG